MRTVTLIVSFFILSTSTCATWANDVDALKSALDQFDCNEIEKNSGLELKILGKRIPLRKGFQFRGFDSGNAAFTYYPEPGDSLRYVYVYYSPTASSEHSDYNSLRWRGTPLLYRATTGGRAVSTTTHLIVIPGSDAELYIISQDIELAAEVAGCISDDVIRR